MHVVVVGGGFAAAELLLALRALAEERVTLELIAPSPRLLLKPAATGHPFGESMIEEYDLRELADDVGARFRADAAEAVASRVSRVRLRSGAVADYDALVLALGARPVAAVPGATTYRDHRDSAIIGRLIADLRARAVRRLAFTVPTGVAWTLPLYELALLAAREIEDAGALTSVTVVTPEATPLAVIGDEVSAETGSLLADANVAVERCARPRRVLREGLEVAGRGIVPADRVVAVPRLAGRQLTGVPANYSGFVATDDRGRVESLSGVYAAGDMTSFPVTQGGIATEQADVIAAELARAAGADVEPLEARHVLRTRLLGPRRPTFLQVELDTWGRPRRNDDLPAVSSEAPWWPSAKLFGRHLSPWMARTRLAA